MMKTLLLLSAALITLAMGRVNAQCKPVRRALVVGINSYGESPDRAAPDKTDRPLVTRLTVTGSIKRGDFADLHGAVNDAKDFYARLLTYGFETKNIVLLLDRDATAQKILDTFQQKLINESTCPDDVSLFFYSGHGSEIRNVARPENSTDSYDQTLVPYDAIDGAPDIRDKELLRLYVAAARKHIFLTVILDSCHSGGMSRGAAFSGRSKALPKDPRHVDDPAKDLIGLNGKQIEPTKQSSGLPHPVLILAASGEKEEAKECDGEPQHGCFTKALLDKLHDHPDNDSVGSIFGDIKNAVQTSYQHPEIFGDGRLDSGLFGQPARPSHGLMASATTMNNDGSWNLDKGTVAGLYKDCELKSADDKAPSIRIRIIEADLTSSRAEVMEGSESSSVRPDLRFKLDRFVSPEQNALRVFYDKTGPSLEALKQAAEALKSLENAGIKIIADPTMETPNHQIWWISGEWQMITDAAGGKRRKLGTLLDPAAIAKLIIPNAKASLFVNFPLPGDSASRVKVGDGTPNSAISSQTEIGSPEYVLVGQWTGKEFAYAWIKPGATEEDQKNLRLPIRSDWISCNQPEFERELQSKILQLNRIKGWLTLAQPGGGQDANQFPYTLQIRRAGSGEILRPGESETKNGEQFKVWLTATPKDIAAATKSGNIAQRWIYVLAIDRNGSVDVIVPAGGEANVGNRAPEEGSKPVELQLTSQPYDFKVGPPYGLDTYLLLASEDQIDPKVLQAQGARRRVEVRGSKNPLAELLGNIGAGTRGTTLPRPVPTNWSVQSLTFRSVYIGGAK